MVTWVGTGTAGFNGDGLTGSITKINNAHDLCLDAAQNLYFIDKGNSRVRKVSATTGIVTTLASVSGPDYMCIDTSGSLYVTTGSIIIKINTTSGATTTFAGTGTAGYSGDGGPATAAQVHSPTGICVDMAGNIYFADNGNARIRKITASTGTISTIAGTGTAGYSGDGGPATAATIQDSYAMCVDKSGNVFFSDQLIYSYGYSYIREIYAATGNIATITGPPGGASGDGGLAIDAGIGGVFGMCVDTAGNLYLCDVSCSCRQINMTTGIINTVAGNLGSDGYNGDERNALTEELNWPYGVFVDHTGSIYIADQSNYRLRKAIQLTHTPSFAYGNGQTISPCTGVTMPINDAMTITDLDSAQTETWSIIEAPVYGTLNGFPYSMLSYGTDSVTKPSGISYTSSTSYVGVDSFRISVTDGTLSDTVTVYVQSKLPPDPDVISGDSTLCIGTLASINLTDTVSGGAWSISNSNATVVSGTVTGIATGRDTVYYTLTAGCWVSVYKVLTIEPYPNPGVITGTDTICLGTSTTFSDTVSSGVWLSSGPSTVTIDSLSGVAHGVLYGSAVIEYFVTVAGCSSTATHPVTLLYGATAVSGSDIVCLSSSIVLSDALPGGTWSISNSNATITGTGTDTALVTGLLSGTDTVIYSNTEMCGYVIKVVSVNPTPEPGTISGPMSICAGTSATMSETSSGGAWSVTNSDASIAYTGFLHSIVPGTDTILYTVSNSCNTAVATAIINIDSMPVAGTILATSSVCVGNMTIISDASAGGAWSVTNLNAAIGSTDLLTGITTGIDTIIYTVSNSCSTVTANAVINIVTVPNPGTISGVDTIFSGYSTPLTNSVAGGIWSSSNTYISTVSGSGEVYGVTPGVDSIIYSVSNSCGTSNTYFYFTVLADTMTGLSKAERVGGGYLLISPNPAREYVQIEVVSSFDEPVTITIINALGEKVKEVNSITNNKISEVIDFPDGIYLLNVSGQDVRLSGRVVKQ